MRHLLIAFMAVILVIFSSCTILQNTESSPTNPDVLNHTNWQMYTGELPPVNNSGLSGLNFVEDENGYYRIWGCTYVPVGIPEGKRDFLTTSSGWRIILDDFIPVGITADDYVVFSSTASNPVVLMLRNGTNGDIQSLFREDVLLDFPNAITGEDYNLYDYDEPIVCDDDLRYVWDAHVSSSEMEKGYGVLDGESTVYRVNMIHKECSSLCYEFRYEIIGEDIYVENLNMNHLVVLPPLHKDSKTADGSLS